MLRPGHNHESGWQLCAYETVALGFSAFCGLFTADEFKGFAVRPRSCSDSGQG